MNKKVKHLLTGVAISSALMVTVSSNAYAEESDETVTQSVPTSEQGLSLQAESENQQNETNSHPSSNTTAPANSENPNGEEQTVSTTLTIGQTALNSGSTDNTGWDGTQGWRYDGSSISLVNNNTATDIKAEGQGFSLSVAGYNHIGTLYADSDVNITGSGILLVDNVDMLQGSNINLLTNTDIYSSEGGSVALFVKDSKDGKYYLVNNGVTGILDDTYTISDNITLVVTAGNKLEMRVLECVKDVNWETKEETVLHYGVLAEDENEIDSRAPVTEIDDNGNTITHKKTLQITFPKLTIGESSTLTIQSGASIDLNMAKYNVITNTIDCNDLTKITVKGKIENSGSIIGHSNTSKISKITTEIHIEDNGTISGEGVLSNIDIFVNNSEQGTYALNTSGDCTIAASSDLPSVNVIDGNLSIISNNKSVSALSVSSADSAVSIYPSGSSKGNTYLKFDTLDIADGATFSPTIVDIYVNGSLLGIDTTTPSKSSIPVSETSQAGGASYLDKFNRTEATASVIKTTVFDASSYETIDFSTAAKLKTESKEPDYVKITYLSDGKVECCYLGKDDTLSIPTDKIISIDLFYTTYNANSGPAVGQVDTSKSNTGAGVLGGQNASSFSGSQAGTVNLSTRSPVPQIPSDNGNSGSSNESINANNNNSNGANDNSGSSSDAEKNDSLDNTNSNSTNEEESKNDNKTDSENTVKDNKTEEKARVSSTDLIVNISGGNNKFHLEISLGKDILANLNGATMPVSFSYEIPATWNEDSLFIVFTDSKGNITVVKAKYDPTSKTISFDAPVSGDFTIICMDWSGTDLSSPEFINAVKDNL